MRKSIKMLFWILLFFPAAEIWSFTLVFKDGSRIEGTWIAETQQVIQIKDHQGVIRAYDKSELDMRALATSAHLSYRNAKKIPEKADVPKNPAVPSIPNPSNEPAAGSVIPRQNETGTLPKVASKRWSVEAGFSNVYEDNINHDEEDIVESVGVVSSLSTRFRNRASNPNFLFRYEIGLHEYTNTDQWDRLSHNVRATHLISLGKHFLLENNGEIAINGSSEDRELGDQYSFRPVLNYFITPSMQVELFAAYRYRKFDTGTAAINRFAGIGFLKEWGDHEIEGYYRYEYNDSQNPRNDRSVSTYSAGYTMPVIGHVTASFAARLRATRFTSRLGDIEQDHGPDIEFLRRDKKWNFKFALGLPLGKKFELVPEYEYEYRTSNDPDKKYDAHEVSLSLVYSVW